MAYDLGFSEEFFLEEGEPYDRADLALNEHGQPISVWSAICKLKTEQSNEWAALAEEIFFIKPELLTEEAVLDKIKQTDTCSNLSSPVSVWIDSKGEFAIKVYEKR